MLAQLTEAERLFVARGFCCMRLQQLGHAAPGHQQTGLRGNVIAFPQDSATLLSMLPQTIGAVLDVLSITFTDDAWRAPAVHRDLLVRRRVVLGALLWLQRHNPHYSNVDIDQSLLAALPEEDIPLQFLAAARTATASTVPAAAASSAPAPATAVRAEQGPAAATQGAPVSEHAALLSGAVLDVANEDTSTLALWERALVSVADADRLVTSAEPRPQDAALQAHAGVQALQELLEPAIPSLRELRAIAAEIPHGSDPLSSIDPSFWCCCFPVLFPWGLGAHGSPFRADISFQAWIRLLLLRLDRFEHVLCRCDLPFIATLFSTRHKRALMQAVRAKIETPAWRATVVRLAQLKAMDFLQVFHVVKDAGGVPEALRSRAVSEDMKSLFRSMRLVQAAVPCTDGARWAMRNKLKSLHYWLGCPVVFLTLNPADVAHPLTLRYSFQGLALNALPLDPVDASLRRILSEHDLAGLVARDPVSAVRSFYHHVRAMCTDLFCCVASSADLYVDGIASSTNQGILGPVAGLFGAIEAQMRGSLHVHFLLYVYGCDSPQMLLRRFTERQNDLRRAL